MGPTVHPDPTACTVVVALLMTAKWLRHMHLALGLLLLRALPLMLACPPNGTNLLILGGGGRCHELELELDLIKAASEAGVSVTYVRYAHDSRLLRSAQQLAKLHVCTLGCSRHNLDSCPYVKRYNWAVDFCANTADDARKTVTALRGHVEGYLHISREALYARPLSPRLGPTYAHDGPLPGISSVGEGASWCSQMWWCDVVPSLRSLLGGADDENSAAAQEAALLRLKGSSVCTATLQLPYEISKHDSSFRLATLLLMLEAGEVWLSPASHVPISFVDGASVSSAVILLTQPRNRRHVCGRSFDVAQPPLSLHELLTAAAPSGVLLSPIGAMGGGDPVGRALLPPTHAEKVYAGVGVAPLVVHRLSTAGLRSLGWQPPAPMVTSIRTASAYIRHHLLAANSTLVEERAELTARLQVRAGACGCMRASCVRVGGACVPRRVAMSSPAHVHTHAPLTLSRSLLAPLPPLPSLAAVACQGGAVGSRDEEAWAACGLLR